MNNLFIPFLKSFHIGFCLNKSDLGVEKLFMALPDKLDLLFVVEGFPSFPEDGMVSLDLQVSESSSKNVAFLLLVL